MDYEADTVVTDLMLRCESIDVYVDTEEDGSRRTYIKAEWPEIVAFDSHLIQNSESIVQNWDGTFTINLTEQSKSYRMVGVSNWNVIGQRVD